MAIEIRLLKDDEYSLVIDFFNSAKSIDHKIQKDLRTKERFEWEFINCPDGKAIYVIAIENDDNADKKIIGTQCVIPFILNSSNKEKIQSAKGEDTLIDIMAVRKYRNRDILKEMYTLLIEECIKRGIKLIWGFTNVPATFIRIGFHSPFFAKNAVLTIQPIRSYKYLSMLNQHNTAKDKFKIFVLSFLSAFYGLKRLIIPNISKKFKYSNRTQENTELFFNAVPANEMYCFLNQNDKFIQWRVNNNPSTGSFKTKQLFNEKNELVAEIIYSNCNGIAYIEQMLFANSLPFKLKLSFIRKIIKELIHEKAIIIRFAGFENNSVSKLEIKLMKKAGFIFAKKGAAFVLRSLTGEKIVSHGAFLLSRLYFQGFRQ